MTAFSSDWSNTIQVYNISYNKGIHRDSSVHFSSQSPMPYSTYRKLSIEEQRKKVEQNAATDENPRIVVSFSQMLLPKELPFPVPTVFIFQEFHEFSSFRKHLERNDFKATAIESTTAVRCHGPKRYMKNWQRPKSMCSSYPDENAVIVDSHSFSQITPPPIHRKFTTVGRSESVQVSSSVLPQFYPSHAQPLRLAFFIYVK